MTISTANLASICQNDVSMSLTLSNPSFGSVSQVSPQGTIQDDDLPVISISGGTSLMEGGLATSTISLSAACMNQTVTVRASTVNGTALSGGDYVAITNQTISFAPGVTSNNLNVTTNDDTIDEPDQTFQVSLNTPSFGTLGTSSTTFTLQDNDPPPSMTLANVSVDEGGTSNLVATLSALSEQVITFDYQSVVGTASVGSDYTAINVAGFTINPLNLTGNLVMNATADAEVCELPETYQIAISNLNHVTYADPNPTITINDMNPLPAITVANVSGTEGANFFFNVSLDYACPTRDMSFEYFTFDISAQRNKDYTPARGTITITAGNTTSSFNVTTLDDTERETPEIFGIGLKNFSFTRIGPAGLGRGTMSDDEVEIVPVKVITRENRACALNSLGAVKCWGVEDHLGYGGFHIGDEPGEDGDNLLYLDLGTHNALGVTPHTARHYAFANSHGCVVLDDFRLKCWGENSVGATGNPDVVNSAEMPGNMGDYIPYINLGTHDGLGITPHTAQMTSVTGNNPRTTCVILDDGRIKCWGATDNGHTPLLGQERNIRRIGTSAASMGNNLPYTNLGTHQGLGVTRHQAVALANSWEAYCAILDTGQVKCWGVNPNSLGLEGLANIGDAPGEMGDNLPYVNLGTHNGLGFVPHTAKSIAGASDRFCAILDTDQVKCWGNGGAVLGQGDSLPRGGTPGTMGDNLPYINLGTHNGLGITPHTAKKIVMGGGTVCAILDTDQVKCWGQQQNGNFGLGFGSSNQGAGGSPGQMGDNLAYMQLGAGRGARDLAMTSSGASDAGGTLVLRDDGTVIAYGRNRNGRLLLGANFSTDYGNTLGTSGNNAPVLNLSSTESAKRLFGMGCALLTNDQIKCWGESDLGKGIYTLDMGFGRPRGDSLGDMGTNLPEVPLHTGRTVIDIESGNSRNFCALYDNGRMTCIGPDRPVTGTWDGNGNYKYRIGNSMNYQDGPGGIGIIKMTLNTRGCAINQTFNAFCWDVDASSAPIFNFGPNLRVLDISRGDDHTCAILSDETLRCWGVGTGGRLGYGDNATRVANANLPAVNLGTGVYPLKVQASMDNTCVLLSNNQVKCFGDSSRVNRGGLNDIGDQPGEMGDNLLPIDFGPGRSVVDLFRGTRDASCAKLDNNDLVCWGANSRGRLGVGSTSPVNGPTGSYTATNLGSSFVVDQMFVGQDFSCALSIDRDVKCWGQNHFGQLGIGDRNDRGDGPGEMGDALPFVDLGW